MADTKIGASALDAQLNYIVTNTNKIAIVENFLRSDTYAQTDAKVVAEQATIGGLFGSITNNLDAPGDTNAPNRRLAVNAIELDPAGTTATGDLSLVLMDSDNSEVLANNDETSDRDVETNDVMTTWAFYIQANQPTTAA